MIHQLIEKITVRNLFGLYTYELPSSKSLSNAAILYGDNGVGKSTVLRLAFHLLSSANNRGHRTELFNTYFESLEVALANNHILTAKRTLIDDKKKPGKASLLSLAITSDNVLLAQWDYKPRSISEDTDYHIVWNDGRIIKRKNKTPHLPETLHEYGQDGYLALLDKIAPKTFILNADRRLDSDSVSDPSDELELRRLMHFEEPKRLQDLVRRSREIALSQAINSASKWISRKAVHSANRGTENVHSTYVNVLHHLVSTSSSNRGDTPSPNDLLKQLSFIEQKTTQLHSYELATPLQVSELKKSLQARSKPKRDLAAGLLQPYIESVMNRLEAVEPIYELLDRFVNIVNELLSDKKVKFQVSQGFSIENTLESPLDWTNLSSGEQQLLLLFCYVLTGRDRPCVFMIDEPEISLNVKWQRQLIKALLDITEGSEIQFIFASHSMELLAQHRDRVVKLVNKNA